MESTYFVTSDRCDVSQDTKLAATSDEVASWVDKRNASRIENWKIQQQQLRGEASSTGSSSPSLSTQMPTKRMVSLSFIVPLPCV